MKWIYFLDKSNSAGRVADLGGKGASLAKLAKGGCNIPASACVVSAAYQAFVNANRIREKILLELNRKPFSDMRWEEIWDASLRIRNYFLHAFIPDEIASQITDVVEQNFFEKPMAVRSSAPDEDTDYSSFAGLHESYLNIRGSKQVLEHIKKVWASLWSDRALLYRQELSLDVSSSAMAVVVQEMITGERSGIVFSQHPEHASQMIIESVYGLNQGLVDGEVEPDRWILNKKDGAIVSYNPPSTSRQAVYRIQNSLKRYDVTGNQGSVPPLNEEFLGAIWQLGLHLENFFGIPQDIEWTLQGAGAKDTEKILLALVYEYSKRPVGKTPVLHRQITETDFLSKAARLNLPFSGSDILELGRASYRLRDDDNIHLGRIEKQLSAAVTEGRKRIQRLGVDLDDANDIGAIIKILRGLKISPILKKKRKEKNQAARKSMIKARQLIGQPASKGIARGRCRLVQSAEDLVSFRQGEVLVVDAIDPNMTFIAPLASAIVERRGGMLIHGAIIAREYGIPCVTGIPEAMHLIENGETITVDGYLGIVTLGESHVHGPSG